MATNFKTLKEYLYPDNGKKKFIIPNYQRGQKWSVRNGKEETSVEYLLSSLLDAFHNNPTQQYFLQGVTVVEEGDNIILIDGQQRTTTFKKKTLIPARISHFPCKIIDFRVNFRYFQVYLHLVNPNSHRSWGKKRKKEGIYIFLEIVKIGCTIAIYFYTRNHKKVTFNLE